MDQLDRLKTALRAQTPPPAPAARSRALRLAAENFARQQTARGGGAQDARPGPRPRIWQRARTMIAAGMRPAALACSCLVLGGFAFVTYRDWETMRPVAHAPAPGVPIRGAAPPGGRNTGRQADAATATAPSSGQDRRRIVPAEAARKSAAPPQPPAPAPDGDAPDGNAAAAGLRRLSRQGPGQLTLTAPPRPNDPILPPATAPAPRDTFADAPENGLTITARTPVSGFSIDVDTASYAYVRSSLLRGALPPARAVRIEEMVNYFTYDYPAPARDAAPFTTSISVTATPWNPATRLVRIGLQGRLPETADRPPLNLVLLIDSSGSMQDPAKLPLLKQSLRLMLPRLRAQDELAIVTYAGRAGTLLGPTPAGDRGAILGALDRLTAGGSTAGEAGLRAAYDLARRMRQPGEIGRVLLATDGDFNLGIDDPAALAAFVAGQRDSGTYLSVLGFGRGSYRDDMMQALAQSGNGQAAYIDTLAEARRVLVDQLSATLLPIADDVKIQLEWNPARVAAYRLIGYETRALTRAGFGDDAVDAGEIGAGHQVTALYEITPAGAPAPGRPELGVLKLRYKHPGEDRSRLIVTAVPTGDRPPAAPGWAAAIAGFGQLLQGSEQLGNWTMADAIALAQQNKGRDPHGLRAEAIGLMQLAAALAR